VVVLLPGSSCRPVLTSVPAGDRGVGSAGGRGGAPGHACCPVRETYLDVGMAEEHGIWGAWTLASAACCAAGREGRQREGPVRRRRTRRRVRPRPRHLGRWDRWRRRPVGNAAGPGQPDPAQRPRRAGPDPRRAAGRQRCDRHLHLHLRRRSRGKCPRRAHRPHGRAHRERPGRRRPSQRQRRIGRPVPATQRSRAGDSHPGASGSFRAIPR